MDACIIGEREVRDGVACIDGDTCGELGIELPRLGIFGVLVRLGISVLITSGCGKSTFTDKPCAKRRSVSIFTVCAK